ncbi:site-specific integrase [Haloarcula sp. 1CSR25-25]|uniref:tyrosine-type recombinase/integrase n=1 Tax=Haloarcula sp. 1CSR25-25 TaxID=2862545 RepID=UPI002898F8F6|nr:site-specific integrase [Haloarcula sp. 1CSR25-25]
MTLEPMTPRDAVESYLNSRKGDLTELSLQNHGYRLERFLEWCEAENVHNMNSVTGRKIQAYANWRAEDVNQVTLKTQLDTLRVFFRFCENIEAIPAGVSEKVPHPDLEYREDTRDEMVTAGRADAILEYLEKYEYASFQHVLFFLLWHTGMRTGTALALDVEDYDSEKGFLKIVHRPKADTPLKNKLRAERYVSLKDELCRVVEDFLNRKHPKVKDEYGRTPLLGTSRGRASATTVRRNIYAITRPCLLADNCPHDKEIPDCDAANYVGKASQCPSTISPHSIRRGAITYHLTQGVPMKMVSDRMDVSQEVLEKHYDGRSHHERQKQRSEYLTDI